MTIVAVAAAIWLIGIPLAVTVGLNLATRRRSSARTDKPSLAQWPARVALRATRTRGASPARCEATSARPHTRSDA